MSPRRRRTSRLDVGLAIAFAGLAFVVWALIAGLSRLMMQNIILARAGSAQALPAVTRTVRLFFVDTGFVIDLTGLGWLAVSLTLIFFASGQRISISWAWLSAALQSMVAALGGVLVGCAIYAPYIFTGRADYTVMGRISQISLPVVVIIAVIIWGLFVYRMLKRRAGMRHLGPTITDGLRTNR